MRRYRWVRIDAETWSAEYRGVSFAEIALSEIGWEVDFFPRGGLFEAFSSLRRAKRWVRERAEAIDLYVWWGIHAGVKEDVG